MEFLRQSIVSLAGFAESKFLFPGLWIVRTRGGGYDMSLHCPDCSKAALKIRHVMELSSLEN